MRDVGTSIFAKHIPQWCCQQGTILESQFSRKLTSQLTQYWFSWKESCKTGPEPLQPGWLAFRDLASTLFPAISFVNFVKISMCLCAIRRASPLIEFSVDSWRIHIKPRHFVESRLSMFIAA